MAGFMAQRFEKRRSRLNRLKKIKKTLDMRYSVIVKYNSTMCPVATDYKRDSATRK
jgi:hypothetical protein